MGGFGIPKLFVEFWWSLFLALKSRLFGGKPLVKKWPVYLDIVQIAFDSLPLCQTGTVLHFLDPFFCKCCPPSQNVMTSQVDQLKVHIKYQNQSWSHNLNKAPLKNTICFFDIAELGKKVRKPSAQACTNTRTTFQPWASRIY